MSESIKTQSNVLADLARIKALFQQRSIIAHLGKMPPGSKADQEPQGKDAQP